MSEQGVYRIFTCVIVHAVKRKMNALQLLELARPHAEMQCGAATTKAGVQKRKLWVDTFIYQV